MNIGTVLKRFREARGYKQGDFAAICNISQTYLSQVEHNRKEANMSTLKTICDKLGLPVPVAMFLSVDQNDVPNGKHEAFEKLFLMPRSLIEDFFINNPSTSDQKQENSSKKPSVQ